MTQTHLILPATAGLVLALFIALPRAGGQAKPAPKAPLKIGLVDVNLVFKRYQKTVASEAKINKEYNQRRAEFRGLAEKIKELEAEIDLIAPGSTLRLEKEERLFLLRRTFEFRRKWAEAEFREKLHQMTQSLYNEILNKIGDHAKQQGYDLVLKLERGPLEARSQEEMKLKIHTRTVIYGRKALDLTGEIIRLLNR